ITAPPPATQKISSSPIDQSKWGQVSTFLRQTFEKHQFRSSIINDISDTYRKARATEKKKQAIQKIKMMSMTRRMMDNVVPIDESSPIWADFAPSAEAMMELVTNPSTLSTDRWIEKGVLKRWTRDSVVIPDYQKFYTRLCRMSKVRYREVYRQYIQKYGPDMAFAVVHATSWGEGEAALDEMNWVLQGTGFPTLDIPLATVAIHPDSDHVVIIYNGTTSNSPCHQLTLEDEWESVEWLSLRAPIASLLAFRTDKHVGDKEAVLTELFPLALNSAEGGWVSEPIIDEDVAQAVIKAKTQISDDIQLDDPAGLKSILEEMISREEELFREVHDEVRKTHDDRVLGRVISRQGVEFVRHELTTHLRIVNGTATSLMVLKDLPRAAQRGVLGTSIEAPEIGRGMASYRRHWEALSALIEKGMDYQMLRHKQGPLLDFWKFIEKHTLKGLLIPILYLYLKTISPNMILGHSSTISQIFQSGSLVWTPRDLGIESMTGPEGLNHLHGGIVQDPCVSEAQRPALDKGLKDRLGTFRIIRYGPGAMDCANLLINHDAGAGFYRQYLPKDYSRLTTLLKAKHMVCQGVTEDYTGKYPKPNELQEKVALLKKIRHRVEEIVAQSGLGGLLATEISRHYEEEMAFDTLSRLTSDGDDKSTNDDTEDEESRTTRGNKVVGIEARRYHGPRAKGLPRSAERKTQLLQLQEDEEVAKMMEIDQPLLWRGLRPSDPEFETRFMMVKEGFSILRSSNGFGRTEKGIQTREDEGKKIAQWNKDKAVVDRENEAAEFGGSWTAAEQYKMLTLVEKTVTRNTGAIHTLKRLPYRGLFFQEYEWIIHLGDALNHSGLSGLAKDRIMREFDLQAVMVSAIWTTTPMQLERLMAWDAILKVQCVGIDPLDAAINHGYAPEVDARSKYEDGKTQYWPEQFIAQGCLKSLKSRNVQTLTCLRCGTFKMNTVLYDVEELKKHLPCNRNVTGKKESRCRTLGEDEIF
ncbi:6341_t:CDS:2, partial [Acaulospora colombiana]